MSRLFTSESVTEGHPDKLADSVSDAVLDALLADDPRSRVAVETLVTTGTVVVAGEVSTETYADIAGIARQRILATGYDHAGASFDGKSCGVLVSLGNQSPDIAQGVDRAEESRDALKQQTDRLAEAALDRMQLVKIADLEKLQAEIEGLRREIEALRTVRTKQE